MEDQVVGQLGDVAPHDPADAERRQPELVARGADRLHPRHAEVPLEVGRAERREERAAGPVDVDVDVEAGVGLQLVERVGQRLHQLVAAGVGDAERRHHEDRVLVDAREHVVGVHAVVARRHRDLAHLDVPVLGELVPHHLHRAAHHVRACRSACPRPRAWPASATWPPCPPSMHASDEPIADAPIVLADSGAFQRSASMCTQRRSISAVCGYSSLSIMFLSMAQLHERVDLRLLPRLAERGQVLAGVAVEHQLVVHDLEGVVGRRISSGGNRYFGIALDRSWPANTESCKEWRTSSRSCSVMMALQGSVRATLSERFTRAPGALARAPG